MTAPIAALIRHGEYHQRPGVPSALQPFALTETGKAQARACGRELAAMIVRDTLTLSPDIHSSRQLRAWQTAQIASKELTTAAALSITQSEALAERSVGSAANLTLDEIEDVLANDPRYDAPPPGWKADSGYCLPLQGAESLMTAGRRVADYLTITMAGKAPGTITLFFGHGASFRHAAHVLGLLNRDEIARYSMHHARALLLCHNPDGTWAQCGGAWKIRQLKEQSLD